MATVKRRAVKRNPALEIENHPFPHINPEYPVQRMNVQGVSLETLSVRLPDGTWIAVEMRPGSYATGTTKAAAESAVRRKIKANPAALAVDEDAVDRAVIRKRKPEKSYPIERLARKFLS